VEVGYPVQFSCGDVTVSQKLPVSTGALAVLMKKTGDIHLTSPQLPNVQEREFQGDTYILAQGPPQAAGTTLTMSISGLPHHSAVPRMVTLGLACVIALAAAWTSTRVPKTSGDETRLKQLKSRREKLFSELVRLEQQRQSGSVDPAKYAERRPALVAQLERIYRDLDTEGGQGVAA
jgi:hypothetical protein